MKFVNAVIIDDEIDSVNLLKLLLIKHCPEVRVVSTFTNPLEALSEIPHLKPDAIFLDIEMPRLNGFELLENLQPRKFAVVFITAYHEYAVKAFKFNALDYLLKPIDTDDLKKAVTRLQHNSGVGHEQLLKLKKQLLGAAITKIAIPSQKGVSFINLNDIVYLEADSNYAHITLVDGKRFIVSKTLKDLQELLEDSHFLRIHRQFIINLNHVQHLDRTKSIITMINSAELIVGRSQKEKLTQMYSWL